jgi:nitrogen fixation protein NifT
MKITIREGKDGLSIYIPKKDLEAKVLTSDDEHPFGGLITCTGGLQLYIEPMAEVPPLPITLEAKKIS